MEEQSVFSELPEALVEEMLEKSNQIGEEILLMFKELKEKKKEIREQLQKSGMLKNDRELEFPQPPTTCGVDGSYAIEKLMAMDLVGCAAVAVEGLTPPFETRHWEAPKHLTFMAHEKRDDDTPSIVRGIMIQMELELAVNAPHDIVMLDGSFTTPIIYMNQAVSKAKEKNTDISEELIKRFESFLMAYRTILEASKSDKIWVSLPKYTTRQELGKSLGWASHYDDRALMTFILSAGEYTTPIPLEKPIEKWHLASPKDNQKLDRVIDEITSLLEKIHVVYYKPHSWMPALRLEIPSSVATNKSRLSILFQGLRYQCGTAGIMEPYPLFMADRMVKHLGSAMPAFRQSSTRQIIELYEEEDFSEIFFTMHGYRTEGGY
ncbi:MAG: NurA domain [Caldanaerobacter subterraneus]|uniref:Nuclease n=1 Tax=Caldanaerobacter subterraneus TaxID=911092 RepID=A0A117KWD8_9THEO|nr:DNA double-strand break repair nuclease NurA [Caldanaerobacter subterraneus]KUK09561.1 MAG: NurA domain [Caldanaerobacter subterraneus]HBT48681.1 nuclease [Caldanaerobacter subterraneus]